MPDPDMSRRQVVGGASIGLPAAAAATALGRPGQPGELGGIFVRLAENDGSYATGQVYGASGGKGLP